MEILGIPLLEFVVSLVFVVGFGVLALAGYRMQARYWRVTLAAQAARRAEAAAATATSNSGNGRAGHTTAAGSPQHRSRQR